MRKGFERVCACLLWWPYGLALLFLPLLVRVKAVGERPRPPCVLAVTHTGGLEPLYVAKAARFWRMPALFSVDPRHPFLRPFYWAFWQFEVRKDEREFNRRTLKKAVEYLKNKGMLMVFPEGARFWEGRLYPGAAVLAKRAGVPLIPVGLENAYVYEPGAENLSFLKGSWRVLKKTKQLRFVRVHFGEKILPDPGLPEWEDVERMMQELEKAFRRFYQDFYGLPGPVWLREKEAV
jgi:1-acyl-sn-glycerol-3-phosphate acyltransferase